MNVGIKSLAAVIRSGDYFVITNNGQGNAVNYSPDAQPGATVVGSFGICEGILIYKDAEQTELALAQSNGSLEAVEGLLSRDAEILAAEALGRGAVKNTPTQEPKKTRAPREDFVARVRSLAVDLRALTMSDPDWTRGVYEGPFKDVLERLGWNLQGVKDKTRLAKAVGGLLNEGWCSPVLEVESEARVGRGGGCKVKIYWEQLAAQLAEGR